MASIINLLLGYISLLIKSVSSRYTFRLINFILKLSLSNYVFSIYKVKMLKNWGDATFRYCVSGVYGFYFSNFLRDINFQFSFIDIGANQGLYSLITSLNKKSVNIYAFEPNPIVRDLLNYNCKLNNASVKIFKEAISNFNGFQTLFYDSSHSGIGSLIGSGNNEIQIPVRDFSIFNEIQDNDKNYFIVKIDVEGFEPIVIESLLKSEIRKIVYYIFLEADENSYDVKSLCEMLNEKGFIQIFKDGSGPHYNLMFKNNNI